MYDRILLTFLLGSVSGILGGAFGLGISVIVLPGLLLLGIIPDYKTAVGTTLLSLLLPTTLFAVREFYKRKQVDTQIGMLLFFTYLIFAYFGSFINKYFSDKTLKYCNGFIFLIIAFYFFHSAYF
jgi:uncharacterized membrane protein YfcA